MELLFLSCLIFVDHVHVTGVLAASLWMSSPVWLLLLRWTLRTTQMTRLSAMLRCSSPFLSLGPSCCFSVSPIYYIFIFKHFNTCIESCECISLAFQVCVSSCFSFYHGSPGGTPPQQKTIRDESVLYQQHSENYWAERGAASRTGAAYFMLLNMIVWSEHFFKLIWWNDSGTYK